MKKFQVNTNTRNGLGALSHHFFEFRVADHLYSVVRNCIEDESSLSKIYSSINLREYKAHLLMNSPLLRRINTAPYNINYLQNYKVYQNEALKLAEIRNTKLGFLSPITRNFMGFDFVRGELNDLENVIKQYYSLLKVSRESKKTSSATPNSVGSSDVRRYVIVKVHSVEDMDNKQKTWTLQDLVVCDDDGRPAFFESFNAGIDYKVEHDIKGLTMSVPLLEDRWEQEENIRND